MKMKTVEETVSRYQDMKAHPSSMAIYREVKWQYQDMAEGGAGGDLGFERNGETTCRGINYKGYPDSFFLEVCYQMAWRQRPKEYKYLYRPLNAESSDPM
jgi:hypothetical protein